MRNKIVSLALAHRIEFTPVTIAIALSFMIINMKSPVQLLSLEAILAFLIINIATYWGSVFNVYYDYELDKKNSEKKYLAHSLDDLNKNVIKALLIIEPLIFLSLGIWLSIIINKIFPMVLLLIGTFFTIAYSLEPLKFKRRGFLNSLSLFLIIMFLPPLYGYLVVNDIFNIYQFILILGLAVIEYGYGLYYTAVDYSEDKHDGIFTPAVILGVVNSVKGSLLLLVIGILFLIYGYINLAYFNAASLIISLTGAIIPFVWIVIYLIKGYNNDEEMERILKANSKWIPLWVAMSAFAIFFANLIYASQL